MNEHKRGNAQEALSTAQAAIQDKCSVCLLGNIHHPVASATPPIETAEQLSGQLEPTIIIHAM